MSRILRITGFSLFLFIAYSTIGQSVADSNQLLLDGTWEILFDHENEGKEGYWQTDSIFEEQS